MDPKLIIALVVCAVVAGVFYWWNNRPDPEVDASIDQTKNYTLVCTQCKKASTVTGKDVARMRPQKGYYQCPQCKAYAANFGSADDLKEKPKSDGPTEIMP